MNKFVFLTGLTALVLFGCEKPVGKKPVVRFGHFPNITHAQGVIAHALSRQGEGWFEQRLGPEVEIQWFTYNAGPSAMEAMFAGSLDVTYVGPNPALNAHFKSNAAEIRIIAGAANGGAALVVGPGGSIGKPGDLRGRKIATPQLGNTQDISCRAWLKAQGFHITQTGGDVIVLPTANPDQLGALQNGDVAAVWTVEPWVTRLEREAHAKVMLEETDVITTWLAASTKFLNNQRELAINRGRERGTDRMDSGEPGGSAATPDRRVETGDKS